MGRFGILIHGGAGDLTLGMGHEKAAIPIVKSSYEMLLAGKNAVDVAIHAVSEMEDSGVFNAGIGSCLTDCKTMEMDAGIMDGKTMQCGAVGAMNHTKNPIHVARKVMYESDHSLLVGAGASEFASSHGIMPFDATPTRTQLEKFKHKKGEKYGTVGAIVLDDKKNLAAAVSTGGMWLKSPGRVGDSAIVGSGYYAKNGVGSAVATGNGDMIMKCSITKAACDAMESGMLPQEAADAVMLELGRLNGGRGGVILIDHDCKVGMAYNTEAMCIGYMLDGMKKPKYSQ